MYCDLFILVYKSIVHDLYNLNSYFHFMEESITTAANIAAPMPLPWSAEKTTTFLLGHIALRYELINRSIFGCFLNNDPSQANFTSGKFI